jgi:hypothetical protein
MVPGDVATVIDFLRRRGEAAVTLRQVHCGVRGRQALRRIEDVHTAVMVLIEAGWVREEHPGKMEEHRRGQPSPALHVHPDLLAGKAR